jgi:hypothetical protein
MKGAVTSPPDEAAVKSSISCVGIVLTVTSSQGCC